MTFSPPAPGAAESQVPNVGTPETGFQIPPMSGRVRRSNRIWIRLERATAGIVALKTAERPASPVVEQLSSDAPSPTVAAESAGAGAAPAGAARAAAANAVARALEGRRKRAISLS